jgi:F-type H+-transporting ATPase subunit delta
MKTSGSKKISERYVTALFEVAQQAGALSVVEKDLSAIAALLKASADFRAFLHNPLLSRSAHEKVAGEVLKHIGTNKVTNHFISLLARHKRLEFLPEIIELFLKKAASMRGELAAELITAKPVSKDSAIAVANALSTAYNKKIALTTHENPAILGGAIINIGSLQLDGSLAGKLNRLKTALHTA